MKKRCLAGMALTMCLLAGCAQSPGAVRLSTEKEMQKYCEKHFGECEVVSVDQKDSAYRITYTMRDTEKDFTYIAVSAAEGVGLDATVFYYSESKMVDFPEMYLEDFQSEYREELDAALTEDGTTLDLDSFYLVVDGPTQDAVVHTGTVLMDCMKEYDIRGYWNEEDDPVYLQVNEEPAGRIYREEGYLTQDEVECKWLLDVAAMEIHCPRDDLEFVSTEFMSVDDIPEAQDKNRVNILGDDNDTRETVRVVHFTKDGEGNYFIADLYVYGDGENSDRTRHVGNYQTPWEKEQEKKTIQKFLKGLFGLNEDETGD